MKQTKPILHNRFNGGNTPVEHLDDSIGDLLVRELIFPYAVRQFDPRNIKDMGKKYDPRRAYAGRGGA
jgi:hypothetical protein